MTHHDAAGPVGSHADRPRGEARDVGGKGTATAGDRAVTSASTPSARIRAKERADG
jgi:hypothetical protein